MREHGLNSCTAPKAGGYLALPQPDTALSANVKELLVGIVPLKVIFNLKVYLSVFECCIYRTMYQLGDNICLSLNW